MNVLFPLPWRVATQGDPFNEMAHPRNGTWHGRFSATLAHAVVIFGEIMRSAGELFKPTGRRNKKRRCQLADPGSAASAFALLWQAHVPMQARHITLA
ncbi:hypothetical protein [Acidithiobacillus sulfuriphilus]|uniref:Uncharacterized protein n=1 Tax=Acidithiobacillus sulfuriphilus TaxID=1867749 RepID=A0ACD5HKI2_9PROT|nr:hypothetical protein [Acidithiobacillus sulfuriphilus]